MPFFDTSRSSPGNESPTVCVIIPTYNRDDLLASCLDCLRKQSFQSFQIVIVDNSPRDSMPAFLKEFDNLKWIPLFRNQGTAGAFNRGPAECKASPYVMVLHNDVELENGSLERLVETLDSDPNYSLAVPKLLQWADSRFLDGVGDAIPLSGGAYRVGHGELDFGQYETPELVFSACAAAALYRGSLFDDIGSFDQDFSPTAKMWMSACAHSSAADTAAFLCRRPASNTEAAPPWELPFILGSFGSSLATRFL